MAQDDIAPLLIGAGALLIVAKWGLDQIPKIPNPIPPVARAVVETADELTGGLQKDRDESWPEWLLEIDVPFSDKRIPLAPGLVPDRGTVYTTGGPLDPGGQMADIPWSAMDIVEPDQTITSHLTEIDLPGFPSYDVRELPGDIASGTIISGPDFGSGQTVGGWLTEIDLPGVPAYDLRNAPGDIYRGTLGRFF
jgi:hypothetical protein